MNQTIPKSISAIDLHGWLQQKSLKPILVDVRENYELEIAPFPEAVVHLPLSESSDWMPTFKKQLSLTQPVVVICHAGLRSWNFGIWLIEQKCGCEVWNLSGGIDAWSVEIDPSVPRY